MKLRIIGKVATIVALVFVAIFARHIAGPIFLEETNEMFKGEGENPKTLTAALQNADINIPVSYTLASDTPQFVLFSFDGSKSLEMLKETRDFAKSMTASGKPLHFTYFINSIYFLTKASANLYQAPEQKPGISNIGFSDSGGDITLRVKEINSAAQEGNEIGSHAVGHFNGSKWSYNDWKQEFTYFNNIFFHVGRNNPSEKIEPCLFSKIDIVGFRAPDLGINDNLYKVLKEFGFLYDASGVGNRAHWPEKDANGIWHIPLGTVWVGPEKKLTISMDYNLWVFQSQGKNIAVRGTELWNKYLEEIKRAYLEYFNSNYNGTRAPVVIANHFSKWNDGVYLEALKEVASEICGKPFVRCTTFKELTDYLNENGAPNRN